jgi:hypothetical protein
MHYLGITKFCLNTSREQINTSIERLAFEYLELLQELWAKAAEGTGLV